MARARAARARGRLPAGADLLRADARQLRLPARGDRARAALRRASSATPRRSSPRRVVRGDGPRRLRAPRRARPATTRSPRRSASAGAARLRAARSSSSGALGVEDVGASFPHRVTYHPTCHSLRLLKVGDAPLRLLRAVRGLDLVELPDAEQCCGFGGTFAVKNADTSTAMLTDKLRRVLDTGAEVCAAVDNSCLMHIGGGLRPRGAGVRVDAPRRDPRLARTHDARASRARRARRWPTAQLRRNLGHATPTIRDKRAGWWARSPDWEALRDAGAAIKDARAAPSRRRTSSTSRQAVQPAGGTVHWARDGAEANAILADIASAHGSDEVIKVKSLATDEIELNDALAADGIARGGDRSRRAHRPARRRRAVAHPRPRDPPQPRARSASCSGARSTTRGSRRSRRARRGGAAHLRAKFLSVPVGVSGANFAVAETGTSASSSPRATGGCARRSPRSSSRSWASRRSSRAGGPRGHAPAAAALVDRRAHEPVHVALDRA